MKKRLPLSAIPQPCIIWLQQTSATSSDLLNKVRVQCFGGLNSWRLILFLSYKRFVFILFCFVLFWRWLLPLSEQNVIGIRHWCWMMLSAVLCCIYTLFWRSYRVELNQNTPVPNTCTLLPTCPHWNCFKSQCRTGCFIYILFILELALSSRDGVSFHKFGIFCPFEWSNVV